MVKADRERAAGELRHTARSGDRNIREPVGPGCLTRPTGNDQRVVKPNGRLDDSAIST
jgi:hypothetical protein